jgi:hypothetical protein
MRRSLLLVAVALLSPVFAAAPFAAHARDAKPDADEAMKQAPAILKEVLAHTKDDKHLAPLAKPAATVEEYKSDSAAGVSIHYETADSWPDLPNKPKGKQAGNGSVQVKILRGTAKAGVESPFQPPKGCYYALSVYGTSAPDVYVSLWSMTGDRTAHRRLEALVRASLKAAGVTMDEKPLRPFVIAGDQSYEPPSVPPQKDK